MQTGIVMSTQSILKIQQELLDMGHKFVLTSRFSRKLEGRIFDLEVAVDNKSKENKNVITN